MPLIYCNKHKRIVNASLQLEDSPEWKVKGYSTKCGCFFKDIKRVKVTKKERYFLPDGTELLRIEPQPAKWVKKK